MTFVLIIWFILIGNMEMSYIMEKIEQSKGKSKHFEKGRRLYHHSSLTASNNVKHWHTRRNRHKPKISWTSDEIHMPFKIFGNKNKYKRLKFKNTENHKFRNPKELFTTVLSIENSEANSLNTKKLVMNDNFKSNIGPFPFNRMTFVDNLNENNSSVKHLQVETKQLISPFTPAISSSSKNKFVTLIENFQMPFSGYGRLIKPRNLPETLPFDQVVHKLKYVSLPSYLQAKKAKMLEVFSPTMQEISLFTSKLPSESRISSKYEQPDKSVLNSFLTTPNQSKLSVSVQNVMSKQKFLRDHPTSSVRHVFNKPKYIPLPLFLQPRKAISFHDSSTSMTKMRLFAPTLPSESRTLPKYAQPVKAVVISFLSPPKQSGLSVPVQSTVRKENFPRDIPQTSSVSQIINEPKYLTLPSFYNFTTINQESLVPVQMSFSTSKNSPPSTILPEYKQPAPNIFIPSSTRRSLFELIGSTQKYMPVQKNVFKDKSRTSKLFPDILPESTILPEYKQPATNIFILNPTSPTHSEITAPSQNRMSEQENLFEDESKTVKPFLTFFPGLNKKITMPFETFKNPTFQQQSETVQGQNRHTYRNISQSIPFNMTNAKIYRQHTKNLPLNMTNAKIYRQHTKNLPLNMTNARIYDQYDKNLKTYNRTSSYPSTIGMNSTEMSPVQHLRHKLKQVKDIHDELGSNTKILVWSIAAILVTVIIILILVSIYKHYKDKNKKKYPFKKKNKFTLLRATREEQKDLLNRIGNMKYSELREEDFEE